MKSRTEADVFSDQVHVLIVGDASDVVMRLRAHLKQHRYEVSTASRGSDALRQISHPGQGCER